MHKLFLVLAAAGGFAFTSCAMLMGPPKINVATQKNDLKWVRRLISQGVNVDEPDYLNYTALTWAATYGYVDVARALLDAKANPNVLDKRGNTPLILAAEDGNFNMARLLLEHGAIVDAPALTAAEKKGGPIVDLFTAARSGKAIAKNAPVPPPAESTNRTASDVDRVPALKRAPLKNAYALVLGVETYRENLPKADYAASDAKLMGEYLSALGFPPENIVVRTDEKASLTDFIKYIENWLPNNVEKGAKVFVYFSGHGTPNPKTGNAYLVPYDGDPTFIESTGYPVERLYAALDKLPTDDVSVVLDSCFSGAGGRSVLAKGARPLVQVVSVTKGTKASVLSAGASDQISNTYDEKGHGLLTYFLLKALGGEGDANSDGTVTLSEAHQYAAPGVQRVARKLYNNEQTPQFSAGRR